MDQDAQRERDELLEEALGLDPGAIGEFLDSRCGDKPELRSDLERLLAANRRMKRDFLERTAATWAVPRFEPGQKLGRYEIEDVISSGGMSIVYRARDLGIDRLVAIKVLLPTAAISTGADPGFLAEVRILGSIRHPNVVQIFDFGELHGVPYIVMEYLDGEDLARAQAQGKCGGFGWKLRVARQLATALEYVHRTGIIHRDLKPANVFIEPTGNLKLMDFGIARRDGPRITKSTTLVGTPEYLSPEQVNGEAATQRSDVYAYGIVLFELFTGSKAYVGNTAEVLYQIAHKDIPLDRLRAAGLPKSLIAIIRSAASKNPAGRPANMEEVVRTLSLVGVEDTAAPPGGMWLRARSGRILAGTLALAGVGVAMWLFRPNGEGPQPRHPTVAQTTASVPVSGPAVPKAGEAPAPAVPPQTAPPTPRQQSQQLPATGAPVTREAEPKHTPPPSEPVASGGKKETSADRTPAIGQAPEIPIPTPPSPSPVKSETPMPLIILPRDSAVEAPPARPTASSAAPVPDEAALRLQSRQEILAVLRQYVAVYSNKDMAGVQVLWPTISEADRKKVTAAFLVAKKIELKLEPQGEPQFDAATNGAPQAATIRFKRTMRMTPVSGKAPEPTLDFGVFRLERTSGNWRIVAQQESR